MTITATPADVAGSWVENEDGFTIEAVRVFFRGANTPEQSTASPSALTNTPQMPTSLRLSLTLSLDSRAKASMTSGPRWVRVTSSSARTQPSRPAEGPQDITFGVPVDED